MSSDKSRIYFFEKQEVFEKKNWELELGVFFAMSLEQ